MAGNRNIPRRTFLSAASAGGIAVAGGMVLAGCTDAVDKSRRDKIEQLQPLWNDAQADASVARALVARQPDRAAALTVIADERTTHAAALRAEMSAIDSKRAENLAAPQTSAAPTEATVDSLRQQLQASAKRAGDVAIAADGYRAGLCGSIAAAVTTEVQVQLA